MSAPSERRHVISPQPGRDEIEPSAIPSPAKPARDLRAPHYGELPANCWSELCRNRTGFENEPPAFYEEQRAGHANSILERDHEMVMRSSTDVTPGADQAAFCTA
jgi:hypothetical protein